MTDAGSIPFTPLLAFGTLVFAAVNFLRFLVAMQWRSALVQVTAWVGGVAVVMLFAKTQFGGELKLGTSSTAPSLAHLDLVSQLFVGLIASSLLSTLNEFKKALDSSDSAAVPRKTVTTFRGHGKGQSTTNTFDDLPK